MDHHPTSRRELTQPELRLIKALVRGATDLILEAGWEKTLLVEPMNDGGMGSLKLVPPLATPYRQFGGAVSNLEFDDADGVNVSVVLNVDQLNVDQNGQLFELDIWKTDFSSLIQIPKHFLK